MVAIPSSKRKDDTDEAQEGIIGTLAFYYEKTGHKKSEARTHLAFGPHFLSERLFDCVIFHDLRIC